MSLVVVTGLGPRTGTSFVMNQARLKGLPIKNTVKLNTNIIVNFLHWLKKHKSKKNYFLPPIKCVCVNKKAP